MFFTSRPSRAEMAQHTRRRQGITADARAADAERIAEIRRQTESISAKSIRAQETEPLQSAQAEFEASFRTLAEQQQATIFSAADPYGTFETPAGYAYADAQTISEHDQLNFEMFQKVRPDYFDCAANIATLKKYFAANGRDRLLTAKTFVSAYDRLSDLGHMLSAQQIVHSAQQASLPKAAPAPSYKMEDGRKLTMRIINEMSPDEYRSRLNHDSAFRDASEFILGGTAPSRQVAPPEPPKGDWGWDPATGEKEFRTSREIDQMSPDFYKRWTRGSIQTNPYVFRGQR
jgi:hypothetical protein